MSVDHRHGHDEHADFHAGLGYHNETLGFIDLEKSSKNHVMIIAEPRSAARSPQNKSRHAWPASNHAPLEPDGNFSALCSHIVETRRISVHKYGATSLSSSSMTHFQRGKFSRIQIVLPHPNMPPARQTQA